MDIICRANSMLYFSLCTKLLFILHSKVNWAIFNIFRIIIPYYAFCNYDDEFVTYYHFLTLYHKASLLYWYLSQEQQQPTWTLAGFVWKIIFIFKSMRQETKKYLDCWWIRVETKKAKYSGRIEKYHNLILSYWKKTSRLVIDSKMCIVTSQQKQKAIEVNTFIHGFQ